MDRKLFFKITLVVLILFLIILTIWFVQKKDLISKIIDKINSITGYDVIDGYGYGNDTNDSDPCAHEPHEPDPCGLG